MPRLYAKDISAAQERPPRMLQKTRDQGPACWATGASGIAMDFLTLAASSAAYSCAVGAHGSDGGAVGRAWQHCAGVQVPDRHTWDGLLGSMMGPHMKAAQEGRSGVVVTVATGVMVTVRNGVVVTVVMITSQHWTALHWP